MITMNLLKFLEENGLGRIGESLFWQNMPLDKNGLYIVNIASGTLERGERMRQNYAIYSVDKDRIVGLTRLEQVIRLLNNSLNITQLPAVEDQPEVKHITIMPLSGATNLGENVEGVTVWTANGVVYL